MALGESQVLWVNDLSGSVNQSTAPHLMAENQFKLLVNVNQTEIGAIGHRLGSERYLDLLAGAGQTRGLHMYEKATGSRYLHMVTGGNLYVGGASTWGSPQESSVWDAASNVDMVNFLNKHYMIGSGATEYLRHATESGSTSVVAGNITGSYLAANGPYLMVVDPANQKAQWSGPGADTFDGADYANINGYATGVGTFGAGRPFVVFTNNNYIVVDPANIKVDEVWGFGAVSHRSIQNIRGYLIFLGRDGFYMLGLNDAFPIELSRLIRNELTHDAIFNKISGSSWEVTASGVIDSRYFCAVRDLSANVKGKDLDDVIVEYDMAQQTVKCHTYTAGGAGSVFAQFINSSGNLNLYAGSFDNKAVYKLLIANEYADQNGAAEESVPEAIIITKDHAFFNKEKGVVSMINLESLHFRYQADSAITVKYSLDGNETYSSFTTLPATTSGIAWDWAELALGKECKTVSLELTCSDKFTIYGIGYQIDPLENTGIVLL